MRTRDWAWWRPLLGLLLITVLYTVAALVVVVLALVTGASPDLALQDLTDPAVLLITNLSLIVAIPIIWVCWAVPHGLTIGWSSSVLGRLRWRLFLPYTWRALLTMGLAVAVTVVITILAAGADVTGPDASFGWLLAVVLLTTPLQSAAEEYVFRGYLSQTIAGWIGSPRPAAIVAAVLSAALFSAAHAPPDLVTFGYRFVFGLALSAVVWMTGGLESSIVLHAVNNVVLFVLGGALGGEVLATEPSALVNAVTLLLGLAGMTGYVGWVAASRRRLHPEVVSPALDLRSAATFGPPAPSWAYPTWTCPSWG